MSTYIVESPNLTTVPSLLLDPSTDDDLRTQAFARIQAASNGTLTDFSVGSVLAALVEGQVFAVAELLYYCNMLPSALALEVYRLFGTQRSAGTYASGQLVFQLAAPLSQPFVINPGYTVAYNGGYYVLTSQLVIPAGSISAYGTVQASQVGSAFNAPAYAIANTSPGLNYLQSIYNDSAITGGTDLETLDALIQRGQYQVRSKQVLISSSDYETAATNLLGGGSATCIPLLSSDKSSYKPGQVHLFLADALGQPVSTGTCQLIQQQLQQQSFVASSVWVDPVSLFPVTVEIVAQTAQLSQDLANTVESALGAFVSPNSYQLGSTLDINELRYQVRQVSGITGVNSVILNRQLLSIPMPNAWTNPFLDTLILTLVQPNGVQQTYYLGFGTGNVD